VRDATFITAESRHIWISKSSKLCIKLFRSPYRTKSVFNRTLGILGCLGKIGVVCENGMKQKIRKPCGKMQDLNITECRVQMYLASAIISPVFMQHLVLTLNILRSSHKCVRLFCANLRAIWVSLPFIVLNCRI